MLLDYQTGETFEDIACRVKTFDDMQQLSLWRITGKVFDHSQRNNSNRNVLYELGNSNEDKMIRDCIINYNKLGLCTAWSQPGREFKYNEPKAIMLTCEGNGQPATYTPLLEKPIWRQKALVNGYMLQKRAFYLQERLKNDDRFIVQVSSKLNESYEEILKHPVTSVFDGDTQIHDQTFSWADMMFLRCAYANIDPTNIVKVSIYDKEWNNNSNLWKTVENIMMSYVENE